METITVTTHPRQTKPSTSRRRRTVAVIAVAAAVLGSFAAVGEADTTDTDDTTEIAFGSTWS